MKSTPFRPFHFVSVGIALCLAQHALAQALPVPRLDSVFPFSGQAGAQVEVTVGGDSIEGTQELIFSQPAIKAEPVMAEADKFYPEPRPVPNKFTVTIPADVPPGAYEVRLSNKLGVTNARRFIVGTQPEAIETEPNNDAETATEVAINSVISGLCEEQQRDFFRFTAKQGQRLIIHCTAQRADSRADVALILYDSAGNVLKRAHDAVRLEPVIDFTPPADGTYVITVNDFVYAGGPQYPYRLSIGTGPWIDFIDPPFATPGAQSRHTLYGRNLPGGAKAEGVTLDDQALEKLEVTIPIPADPSKMPPATDTLLRPADGSLDIMSYQLKPSTGVASNPVRIALVNGSLIPEAEPNDAPEQAQLITLPAQIIGRSSLRGDRDWVAFEAKKGEQFWLEMTSRRLDLPTDPVMVIQQVTKDAEGKETVKDLAEVDDQARLTQTIEDPRYRFTAEDPGILFTVPEDGRYRVQLRDLYGSSQGGPEFFYLFTARPAQPDFSLATYGPRPDMANANLYPGGIIVRKGGSAMIEVLGFRRDGFAGEIELTVEGLPPGVTAQPAVMAPFADYAAVVVQATPQAANWAGPIQVVGKAKLGETEAVRVARPVEAPSPSPAAGNPPKPPAQRIVQDLVLAVRDDATVPFTVTAGAAAPVRMARGGKLAVPITVTRAEGFAGDVKLTPQTLVQQVKGQEVTVAAAETAKTIELDIDPAAPLGRFSVVLRGEHTVQYTRSPEVAAQAEADATRITAVLTQAQADMQKATQARQAAEQALQQATTAATAAETARAQAEQQKKQADAPVAETTAAVAQAKAAVDTAAAAAKAAPDDAAAKQALAAAEAALAAATKQLETLTTAATAAAEKLTAAEAAKTAADETAATARKTSEEATLAATQAQEFAKQADAAKKAADEKLRIATETAKPREVKIPVPSSPATIQIVPSPWTATVTPAAVEIKAGGDPVSIAAAVAREFDFTGEIKFELVPPQGVQGISFVDQKNLVPASQNQAELTLQAAPNATPGPHTINLRGRYNFNGRDMTFEQPLQITVTPPEAAKE